LEEYLRELKAKEKRHGSIKRHGRKK